MATILDELVVRLGADVDTSKLRRFGDRIDRIRGRLNSLAAGLGKLGAGLTAAGAGPVVAFANFESNLAKIEGLVGTNRETIKSWRGDIERIAQSTGIGPGKLADAMFFIASAQLDAATSSQVLESSAKAAAAGLGDQAQIADLLTSAIGAYGAEELSAVEATDQLVAAVREGKLDPETLAGPLSKVIPFAQELGVEFHEVAGAMAAMSKTGIDAATGGTALRGIFTKLIKPTEIGRKALEEVGLSMDGIRAEVKEKGLLSALRSLRNAFGDDDEAIGKVFEDSQALLGVFALSGDAALENAAIIERVGKSTGVTDEAFKKVSNTMKFQWKRALATGQTALIGIGEQMAPMIRKAIDFVQRGIRWFNELSPGIKKLVGDVLLLGPVLLAAAGAIKGISFAMGALSPIMKIGSLAWWAYRAAMGSSTDGARRVGMLRKIGNAIRWVGRVTKIGTVIQWAMNAAVMANPIGLIIAAIIAAVVALAAAAYFIYKHWDTIVQGIGDAWEWFLDLISRPLAGAFGWLSRAWNAVMDFLGNPIQGMWDWLKGTGEETGIFAWITNAWDVVKSAFTTGPADAWKWLKTAPENMFVWLTTAWDAVKNAFTTGPVDAWNWLKSGPANLFAWLTTAWDAVKAAFTTGPTDIWNWLTGPALEEGKGVFDWLTNSWNSLTALMSGAFAGIWDNLTPNITAETMLQPIRDAWNAVLEWLNNFSLAEVGTKILRTLVEGVTAVAEEVKSAVLAPIEAVKESVIAPVEAVVDSVSEGITGAADTVAGGVSDAFDAVTDLLPWSDAKKGPLSNLTAAGKAIIDTIAQGIQKATPLTATLAAGALALPSAEQLANPFPAAPLLSQVGAGAVPGQPGGTTYQITFAENSIIIHAEGGDAQGISDQLVGRLNESMRGLREQVDTQVEA